MGKLAAVYVSVLILSLCSKISRAFVKKSAKICVVNARGITYVRKSAKYGSETSGVKREPAEAHLLGGLADFSSNRHALSRQKKFVEIGIKKHHQFM
jgi:hypothetical protein